MSGQVKNVNVGFLGENLLGNAGKVPETLGNNVKSMNPSPETQSNNQPGLFDKIKNTFSKKCDCPCDDNKKKNASGVTTIKTTNTAIKPTKNSNSANKQSNKNGIKLFGSLKNEKGYVVLLVQLGDNAKQLVKGGKFDLGKVNMKAILDLKKNIPNLANVKKQINEIKNENKMIGVLKKTYESGKEITKAIKQGNTNAIKKSIEKTTGINIDGYKRNTSLVSNTKNTSKNIDSPTNSNVDSDEPIVFSLKVTKTQTESKSNIPASILSILDYLVTYKGIELSNIKTLDDMVNGVLSFFSIEEPQSMLDIFSHFGNVFGELTDISGMKSLYQNNNIITFDKVDSVKSPMNEWDVIKILYNKLIRLKNGYIIDISFVKDLLSEIKLVCGNVQSVNLEKVGKFFTNKLKDTIAHQCNNIETMSTKEMETIKQSFIDTICSKDDKYAELASFLVIYLNFFLNELLGKTIEDPQISTILQQQVYLDINLLNTVDKHIVLHVKSETIKEFLEKFSDDKIIIKL
jgi:hypothetical protein